MLITCSSRRDCHVYRPSPSDWAWLSPTYFRTLHGTERFAWYIMTCLLPQSHIAWRMNLSSSFGSSDAPKNQPHLLPPCSDQKSLNKFLFPVLCCLPLAHILLPGPLSLDLRPCMCNHSPIAAQNCITRVHCMAFVCNHSLNLICNFEFGCLSLEAYLLPSEYSTYDYFHVFGIPKLFQRLAFPTVYEVSR